MALETLVAAKETAAELTGVPTPPSRTELHTLGMIAIGDREYPAFRAHTGPEDFGDLTGKGGLRIFDYPDWDTAVETVTELSPEMWDKLALRGYANHYMGGKGLIVASAKALGPKGVAEAMRQYEGLMEGANIAGSNKSIPAGDVGSNGFADVYALERRRRHPNDDPYWQASITGKSPELGGLEFRTAATGWGTYRGQLRLMDNRDIFNASATAQGFGNVGAWYGYFATNDPDRRIRLQAYGEWNGTLSTDAPEGLIITREMVEQIGDNPKYQGNKLVDLARMIHANQPNIRLRLSDDPGEILTMKTDYFVPMALGNAINLDTVRTLGARKGVIEGANGPTTPEAHQIMMAAGFRPYQAFFDVLPDIVTNGAGVDCSNKEAEANITGVYPSTEKVQKELADTSDQLVDDVMTASERMGTRDLRVGAAALSGARASGNTAFERELVG